jgi:hypothetical protein
MVLRQARQGAAAGKRFWGESGVELNQLNEIVENYELN